MRGAAELAVEISRVAAAAVRHRAAMDDIKESLRGGDQGAHEHNAAWGALADKLGRTKAWLCVLLRKRGTADDLSLARAADMGAWP